MEVTRLERRLRFFVAVVATLLVLNDLLPYLGLRDDSCQTMFSGLTWAPAKNNHYLMPQVMVSDVWRYYVDVRAELDPAPPPHGRARDLYDWLVEEGQQKNAEAIRVVVRQLCERGHRVRLSYRYPEAAPDDVHTAEDACADTTLSDPNDAIPIRLYGSAYPWEPLP